MSLCLLISLFLTITPAAPQYSTGVRLHVTTGANQPLKKAHLKIRIHTLGGLRCPLSTEVITDNAGVATIGLFGPRCRLHIETSGFDDYTVDVTIKEGEITTVAAHLEPVEELTFERLPAEQVGEVAEVCRQSILSRTEFTKSSFDNEQQWKAFWSGLNLVAPTIDFKKQRVVASIVRASVYLTGIKIRRITYNPTRKTISVRRIFPGEHSELWLQALSCNVDMVLIPVRDGTVIFQ